jgi:hypothetical protein
VVKAQVIYHLASTLPSLCSFYLFGIKKKEGKRKRKKGGKYVTGLHNFI